MATFALAQEEELPGTPDDSPSTNPNWPNRVWTSKDQKQVIARAVDKKDDKVTLRLKDGKRVKVAIKQLSDKDVDWLNNWTPKVIYVTTVMRDCRKSNGKKRVFIFKDSSENELLNEKRSSYSNNSIEIYEDDFQGLPAAIVTFNELISKPMKNVREYSKVILRQTVDVLKNDLPATYEMVKMVVIDGNISFVANKRPMTAEEIIPFYDFLEVFSIREWEREQKSVERLFK